MLNKTTYRDLIVWQKAMELVTEIYSLTSKLPDEEKYGLKSQMRRCVVSIPSNIAEGKRRGSSKQLTNFLLISFGSGSELETQIEITIRLGFLTREECKKAESLLEEVMKMLNKMLTINKGI